MKRRIPKTRVFVDVESASEVNIKVAGGRRYAEDPTTFPRCIVYAVNGGTPKLWTPKAAIPDIFYQTEDIGFYAHNADGMEIDFFELVMTPRFGWPSIPDSLWYDTLSEALACGLPGKLEKACIAAGVKQGKDTAAGSIVRVPGVCSPDLKALENGGSKWHWPHTHPEEFRTLYKYCIQDVIAMRELYLKLPMHVTEEEDQRPHFLDCIDMNRRGLHIDIDTVHHIQKTLTVFKESRNKQLIELTEGEITRPTQRERIRLAASKLLAYNIPNMQGQYLEEDLIPRIKKSNSDAAKKALTLLEVYLDCGNTSVAKYEAMIRRICADGTIKNNFVFHGTSPGRYASRGVQVQNMPRPAKWFGETDEKIEQRIEDIWNENFETLDFVYGGFSKLARSMIRSVIVPGKGYKFLCADFKQIEARAVPWHCNDLSTLELINQGNDLYVIAAAGMYHVPIQKVTSFMRQAGKVAVLACGFEGGWSALVGMARNYGIELTEEDAREIVRRFRHARPLMVEAWYSFLRCAKLALSNPGKIYKVPKCQPTYFQKRGEHLFMRLPSNRELVYWGADLRDWPLPWGGTKVMPTCMWVNSGPKGNHRWERRAMRGGHFFQNAIQGECSDLLKDAQYKLKREGFEPVLTLHDEPLVRVPDSPEFTIEFFKKKFTEGSSWAKGLPMGADVWEGYRYKKV